MNKSPLTVLVLVVALGRASAVVAGEANEAQPKPKATPLLGSAGAPVSGGQRTLADVARENKLRKEKRQGTLSITGDGDGSYGVPAGTIGGEAPSLQRPSPSAPDHSTDQQYWQSRAERARQTLEAAQRTYAQEEARVRHLMTDSRTTEELGRVRQDEKKRLGTCRIQVENAKRELEALPEKARKSGANPGWTQ